MKINFLYKRSVLIILCLFLYSQNNEYIYNSGTNVLEEKTNLEKWLSLFEEEKSNYQYLKKVKPLLLEQKKFDKLINLYEQHIKTINTF